MRKIAIIASYAFVTRQYLRTPVFNLLRNNPDNFITIYTPAKRLAKEFRFPNVRVRSSKFFFGINKSDLIVIPEWQSDVSKLILRRAKRWGIPTFFVQEGAGNPSAGFTTDIYPTRICVWGPVPREIYIKRGIDPERITITGQPRFDWYHNLERKRLFPEEKKILLFATQTLWRSPHSYPGSKEVIIRQYNIICQISQKLGLQLVCKLHPSDDPNLYKREGVIILEDTGVSPKNYLKEYCINGYDPKISDMKKLGQIFSSCDVATTFFSTAGLEAMILGKPNIFFDTAGYYKKFQITNIFINRCRFALAANKNEFFALLEKYLKNPDADSQERKKVVYEFAYKQDGQASERVVAAMEEVLSR